MKDVLAFDVYGTIVDPIRIWTKLEDVLPDRDAAKQVANVWRQKQQEYTFRLVAMGEYHDFKWVNSAALRQALDVSGQSLDESTRRELVEAYDDLQAFDDVHEGLRALREGGYATVILSNGTPQMLRGITASSGLEELLPEFVSVDDVRTFKPDPAVYEYAAKKLDREIAEIRLVSANPVDNIGAMRAGMQAVWVNRAGGPFDALGDPQMTVATLTELAEKLV